MSNINEIIRDIKNDKIKYPELRQGETFVDGKIFLHLYKPNGTEVGEGKLFNSLEEGAKYFGSLKLQGEHYIVCKEAKNPSSWRINVKF